VQKNINQSNSSYNNNNLFVKQSERCLQARKNKTKTKQQKKTDSGFMGVSQMHHRQSCARFQTMNDSWT